MRTVVVRSLVLAAAFVVTPPGARAQGMDACTDLPVTALLARADPEASHAASISLFAVGAAPGCRPLGIGQPPPLGSIAPPAFEVAPSGGDDPATASVAAITDPLVGIAVAAGGAAAWVAAGAGTTNAFAPASGAQSSDAVAPEAVAPNVILNPEPATLVLCATGLAALGVALRHRLRS